MTCRGSRRRCSSIRSHPPDLTLPWPIPPWRRISNGATAQTVTSAPQLQATAATHLTSAFFSKRPNPVSSFFILLLLLVIEMFDSNKEPVWDPDIKTLFVQPPWLDPNEAQIVGADWIAKMTDFGIQLDHYDSVKQWSVTIYYHLHSRNMPLTTNEAHFFPPEAL